MGRLAEDGSSGGRRAGVLIDKLSRMRAWNRFTFCVYVAFGVLAGVAGLAGIALLYFAPGAGVVALIIAVLLGALSRSTKRSYDAVTRND